MAKEVTVDITTHPLSREENGVTFNVSEDGARFGQLVVSKGGVRWKPKGKQDHHFMNWQQLDAAMRELPKR